MEQKHVPGSSRKRHYTRSQRSLSRSDDGIKDSPSKMRRGSNNLEVRVTERFSKKEDQVQCQSSGYDYKCRRLGSSSEQGRVNRSDSLGSQSKLRQDCPKVRNIKPHTDSTETEESDIEKEYMPHEWSTRHQSPEEVLQQYINFATKESEKASNLIPHEIDITYDSFNGQKLDIFGTDLSDESPILVYVHGGYWKQFSKEISRFPAVSFYKCGVKTIVVAYSRKRKTTLWDIVDQVTDAICYVLRYANEKGSSGVYIAGHNSGAHIIAKVLGNSELFDGHLAVRLNGVFFISGLYDLRDFCLTSINEETVKLPKIDAVSLSPLLNNYYHLEKTSIYFYVIASQEDSATYKKQSRDFYDALSEVCPTENMFLEIKDDMDHYEIVKCLANDDNYLQHLILHDLAKHQLMST